MSHKSFVMISGKGRVGFSYLLVGFTTLSAVFTHMQAQLITFFFAAFLFVDFLLELLYILIYSEKLILFRFYMHETVRFGLIVVNSGVKKSTLL